MIQMIPMKAPAGVEIPAAKIAQYLAAKRWRESHIADHEMISDPTFKAFLARNDYRPDRTVTIRLRDGKRRLDMPGIWALKDRYAKSGVASRCVVEFLNTVRVQLL